MEAIIVIGLISYVCLCLVVGWVSEKRGRGSALGFWLSFFFSPVVGLLVLLALGGENGAHSDSSSAAIEWVKVSGSLDIRDYEDFAQAFPRTKEAHTALKQRRLLEEWQRIDQTDGQVVEEFSSTVTFPELSAEVRKVVEQNATSSASLTAYLKRLRTEEQLAIELAAKKKEQQAAQAAQSRKKANQTLYVLASIAVLIALAWLYFSWIDQNNKRRILQDAGIDATSVDLGSKCADQEVSLLLAEIREREENSELRDRIQIVDAKLTESSTSSGDRDTLTQELSALRSQLVTSQQYREVEVARDVFYDCQSSAGR